MADWIWNLFPLWSASPRRICKVLSSEVHQMFGRYHGTVTADDGEIIRLDGLVGFAEEHHAKW